MKPKKEWYIKGYRLQDGELIYDGCESKSDADYIKQILDKYPQVQAEVVHINDVPEDKR